MFILNPSRFSSAAPTGLLSRWLMNDGSGTTAVDSVSARNFTLTNGPTWGASSVILDGVDDYLVRSGVDFGFNGGTELSVSFYMKTSQTLARVFNKEIADGDNTFGITINGGAGILRFLVTDAAGNQPTWDYIAGVSDNTFHLVTFTFKNVVGGAADVVIYVDRTPVSTTFTANGYTSGFVLKETSNNLYIGIRPVTLSGTLYAGEIKDIQVYNRQLSGAEVTALP